MTIKPGGLLTLYAGGAISWIRQKQSSNQLSTTGAEVVAASDMVWLKRLLSAQTDLWSTPVIFVENESSSTESRTSQKNQTHLNKHFFIHRRTSDRRKSRSEENRHKWSDVFTKTSSWTKVKGFETANGTNLKFLWILWKPWVGDVLHKYNNYCML